MKNPWKDFVENSKSKNLVLADEKDIIKSFNKSANELYKIHTDIMPAPFMGDVLNSQIVILTLNPGYDKQEDEKGYYTKYISYWEKQIEHIKPVDNLPLFCLEEEYIKYSNYWDKKLKPLIELTSREKVAKNISIIQYFPYHSLKYKNIPKRILNGYLKSQEYNFQLVREAIKREAIIILLRSEKLWLEAVPELEPLKINKKLYRTNSYLNPTFSEGNLPIAFDLIRQILNKE